MIDVNGQTTGVTRVVLRSWGNLNAVCSSNLSTTCVYRRIIDALTVFRADLRIRRRFRLAAPIVLLIVCVDGWHRATMLTFLGNGTIGQVLSVSTIFNPLYSLTFSLPINESSINLQNRRRTVRLEKIYRNDAESVTNVYFVYIFIRIAMYNVESNWILELV